MFDCLTSSGKSVMQFQDESLTMNKYYKEIGEEWENWGNNFSFPLEKSGVMGRE